MDELSCTFSRHPPRAWKVSSLTQSIGSRMTISSRSRSRCDAKSPHKHVPAETMCETWLEEAMVAARGQLEEEVLAWNADVRSAKSALDHELVSQKNQRLSEARGRLQRLESTLLQAPDQIVEHLRQ